MRILYPLSDRIDSHQYRHNIKNTLPSKEKKSQLYEIVPIPRGLKPTSSRGHNNIQEGERDQAQLADKLVHNSLSFVNVSRHDFDVAICKVKSK